MVGHVAEALQELRAAVVRVTDGLAHEVLDEKRHASERSVGQRCPCLGAGLVEALVDDGVQRRVDALDAVDGRIDQLEWRGLTRADEFGLCSGVGGCEIHRATLRPRNTPSHRYAAAVDIERWLKAMPAWAIYTVLGLAVLGGVWIVTIIAHLIGFVLKVAVVGAVVRRDTLIVASKSRESGAK